MLYGLYMIQPISRWFVICDTNITILGLETNKQNWGAPHCKVNRMFNVNKLLNIPG